MGSFEAWFEQAGAQTPDEKVSLVEETFLAVALPEKVRSTILDQAKAGSSDLCIFLKSVPDAARSRSAFLFGIFHV